MLDGKSSSTVYFTGGDHFHGVLSRSPETVVSVEPVKLPGIVKLVVRFELAVFQKLGCGSKWFVQGQGVPEAKELFSSEQEVNDVCITNKEIIGLRLSDSTLYRVALKAQLDDDVLCLTSTIVDKCLEKTLSIIQICSNDTSVFILDYDSCIYEVRSTSIELKWRVDNVKLVKLACGFGHFIALSDTGALYSWGNGGRGELGHVDTDYTMTNCEQPKRIDFFDDLPSTVRDVSCGGWHTLALTSDGDVYSWGWNESGQLGHSAGRLSNILGHPYPVDLGSAEDPIVEVASGARHSLARLKSGKAFSWGLNKYGQLGIGHLDCRNEPTEILHRFEGKLSSLSCGRWSTIFYVL